MLNGIEINVVAAVCSARTNQSPYVHVLLQLVYPYAPKGQDNFLFLVTQCTLHASIYVSAIKKKTSRCILSSVSVNVLLACVCVRSNYCVVITCMSTGLRAPGIGGCCFFTGSASSHTTNRGHALSFCLPERLPDKLRWSLPTRE